MKITDLAGCTGWAALFVFAAVLIPFVGPFISILTPLPFLYFSTKLGFQEGIKVTFISLVVIGIISKLTGLPQMILVSVEMGALGLVLYILFCIRLTIGQIILSATVFMLLVSLGYLFILGLSKDMGPVVLLLDTLHGHMAASVEVYKEMGVSQENILELERYSKIFIEIVFPSLAIVGIGFVVWLNVVMAKLFFRRGNLPYPEFVPMDHWKAPEKLIWGVIVSGFALFLFQGTIKLIATNVLIVVMVIYLFHGLSILIFFLNKYKMPSWIRVSVYLLIIIQQFFWLFLGLAGLFDQWVDFRKLHKEPVG